MDCRKTQSLLTAFHDGELPVDERARVEEHLRGCPECGALLADLARADQAAGVPDPGPAYWDRFNARVMDRVEREADGPGVAVLRPKGGWMREQLRYLVPAAAAAALVVVVVRYGGMHPGAPAPTAMDAQVPGQAGMPRVLSPRPTVPAAVSEPAAPPPSIADERLVTAARGERDRRPDRPLSEAKERTSRDRAAAPAGIDPPSDGHVWPSAGAGRDAPDSAAPAPAAEPRLAAKAESASGMNMAKDPSAEASTEVSLGKTRSKAGPSPLASAPRSADGHGRPSAGAGRDATGSKAPAASPCELARTLAERERFREAEAAQRACLAQDRSAPTQEKGLVFLAELLDRQARFAEADAVIMDVDRQFPQSRPLDLYRQQRPMVQKEPTAVPVTR
jgi:hypothetical protein